MPSVLAINGSARDDGDTAVVLDAVLLGRPATRLDLVTLDIRHYEYGRALDGDDFTDVVSAMAEHDHIVFATPIYWCAMSGRMKVLFDRFTDLATVRRDVGRSLRGRRVYVVACGSDGDLPNGFDVPFRNSSLYLNMEYRGLFYVQTSKGTELTKEMRTRAAQFGNEVFS